MGLTPGRREEGADPKKVRVYQSRPATGSVAGWTRQIVDPILLLLQSTGRPIEFRSTGRFGGWSPRDIAQDPEQRIQISNLVLFQHKSRFVTIYVHELAHALIDDAEAEFDPTSPRHFHQHNAAFFCLNLYFFRRLDEAGFMSEFRTDREFWSNTMSLYDLQDPPLFYLDSPRSQWRPNSLAWALEVVDELMSLRLTAEAAAVEVVKRYWAWTDSHFMQAERDEDEKKNQLEKRAGEEQKLALMRSDLQLFRWLSVVLGLGFLTLFYYLMKA